jgi:hypothetical protein
MDDHSVEYYEYQACLAAGFEMRHAEMESDIDPGPPSSSSGVPAIFCFDDRWCIIVENTLKYVSKGV